MIQTVGRGTSGFMRSLTPPNTNSKKGKKKKHDDGGSSAAGRASYFPEPDEWPNSGNPSNDRINSISRPNPFQRHGSIELLMVGEK